MSELNLVGVPKTAYEHIIASKPRGKKWENFQMENIEPVGEIEDGIFLVTFSWVSGEKQQAQTVKVQKFADERENIVLTD